MVNKPIHYTDAPITATLKYGYESLANALPDFKNKKILDYGSGTGRLTKFLYDLGADIAGVDVRRDMIETAQKQYPKITFKLISNNKVPWPDNSFDLVVTSFVHIEINSLAKMKQMHQEIKRILKPKGQYFILTVNSAAWRHQYDSFSSNFPSDFTGQSGQKINTQIQAGEGMIKFQDYYWQKEDYLKSLESSGFKLNYIKEINAEKEPAPFWLINAVK